MVELARVSPEERPALETLLDEYLAELSGHRERPIGAADARSYAWLPLYWTEPGRHPFFLCVDGERVGFALVWEVPGDGPLQMAELYVRPSRRRAGVGGEAVAEIWRRFPGSWELQTHARNAAALAFWRRCIEAHATGPVLTTDVAAADGRRVQWNFAVAAQRERGRG